MVGKILEFTFTLILVYLIVVNWRGFSNVMRAGGEVYAGAVKVLQGR